MMTLNNDGTKIMGITNPFGFTASSGSFNKYTIYFKTPVSIDLATEKCAELIDTTTDYYKALGYPWIAFYFDIDLNGSYWSSKTWQN